MPAAVMLCRVLPTAPLVAPLAPRPLPVSMAMVLPPLFTTSGLNEIVSCPAGMCSAS